MKAILIAYICLFFFTSYISFAQEEVFISAIQKEWKKAFCKISWVDDGDTLNLACSDGNYQNVRLLGINAPDKDIENNRESCYYSEAKAYLEKRIGQSYVAVFYGSDLCKDPYKGCRNLVRLIDLKNSSDLGQSMILHGLAFSWTNFSMIPRETRGLYDWMERISSQHKLGLWRSCQISQNQVTTLDEHIPPKMTTYNIPVWPK